MWSLVPGCRRSIDDTARGRLTLESLTAIISCSVVREGCFSRKGHGAAVLRIDDTCANGETRLP